jgi:hypothetical protein
MQRLLGDEGINVLVEAQLIEVRGRAYGKQTHRRLTPRLTVSVCKRSTG